MKDYNPCEHPKVKMLFREIPPLTEEEARMLSLRLQNGDLGVTMDDIVKLTGKDRSVIGRILSRARVKPTLMYDFDDVAPYLEMKQGLVFGDDYDLTTPTEKKCED
jgi:hypothetical protein